MRTFEIVHTPNTHGFEAYTIHQDNGRPCLDNPPVICTDEKMDLVRALVEWMDREC